MTTTATVTLVSKTHRGERLARVEVQVPSADLSRSAARLIAKQHFGTTSQRGNAVFVRTDECSLHFTHSEVTK
jgi:hypothetical protein